MTEEAILYSGIYRVRKGNGNRVVKEGKIGF